MGSTLVMLVVVGLLGFKLIGGEIHHQREENRILSEGGRAMAEITGKKINKGSRGGRHTRSAATYYAIYYRFKDGQGNWVKGKRSWLSAEDGKVLIWDKKDMGDAMEVAYDPNFPDKNFPVLPDVHQ